MVSIHAPARGATPQTVDIRICKPFQSTRPQGARLKPWAWCKPLTCFNPRARKGRDGDWILFKSEEMRFNPRARKGRDMASASASMVDMFQSTRPQGARRIFIAS